AASIRIAELAKRAGAIRYVFASSCSIYGSGASAQLTEEDAFNPLTAYARSKVETEYAVQELADERFSPIFMRNATVYGFSPRLRFDLVVNNLTGWAVTTHQVKLLSDGRAWRPLLHVDDMCQAFLKAIEAPREAIHNQAFNVGNEEDNWMIRDIAEKVATIVPDCAVIFAEGAGSDTRNYNVSFAKIRERLPSFQSRWNVPKGIEQLYAEFARIRLTEPEFASRTYTRLKQIQFLIDSGRVSGDLRWVAAPAVSSN
ncbi:MAG TPA: SDR family oxidoreductase, partial [Fimbriimonadaceae bacterium]|nr:SDR family oxidoreductase [Fimbriimonadaceae bacterium]